MAVLIFESVDFPTVATYFTVTNKRRYNSTVCVTEET